MVSGGDDDAGAAIVVPVGGVWTWRADVEPTRAKRYVLSLRIFLDNS